MALDPYQDWLQIANKARPLNHYELLGLKPFEADESRIQTEYARAMSLVRRYQVGAHMEVAQRVISELSEAYATLTHPQQRAAYDRTLRAAVPSEAIAAPKQHTQKSVKPLPPPEPPRYVAPPPLQGDFGLAPSLPVQPSPIQSLTRRTLGPEVPPRRKKKRTNFGAIAWKAGLVAVILAGLYWVFDDDATLPGLSIVNSGLRRSGPAAGRPQPGANQGSGIRSPSADNLETWLASPPALNRMVPISAIVQDVSEGELTVIAKPGDIRSVRLTFEGAPQSLFTRLGYRPGLRVKGTGYLRSDEGHDPPWRIEGIFLRLDDVPRSTVSPAVIHFERRRASS